MINIIPHGNLTDTLTKVLIVEIAANALALLVGFYSYYSYINLPASVDPHETWLISDYAVIIVGWIQLIVMIIFIFFFFRWIYLTNKNLHILADQGLKFTPGWSIGWFFIPVANFFKPYQAMKEIWRISHNNKPASYKIPQCWWFLWLASMFLGYVAFEAGQAIIDIEGYIYSAKADIYAVGCDLALDIIILIMVTKIAAAYANNINENTSQTQPILDNNINETETTVNYQ